MSEVGHVTTLSYQGKEILIIGTAHVSQKSVDEVWRVIREERPDTVCVELDEARYQTLVDKTTWQKLDIFEIIRQKRVLFLLSSLALGAYQRRMGEKLGVMPGAELLAGVEAAREVGAEVVLADRDVQATLKRTWANLGFWDKAQMAGGLISAPFAVEDIDETKIEELKDKDTIGEIMHQVAEEMPRIKTPLIDERDAYLMSTIQAAPGKKIVGVVGAAHVAGMVRRLGEKVDHDALCEIPAPSALSRSLKWIIPLLMLSAFSIGYYKHQGQGLAEMLEAWVLPNAIFAGLFSIVALAHPLSVLTAFVASPITSLNPTIGAGLVAGLVEAYLRKPTVEDCEGVQKALTSVRAFYGNRVTRVLLVTILASVGSSVGAFVGAGWVLSLFW
jgi:pheromone shutdown-related protein TraB